MRRAARATALACVAAFLSGCGTMANLGGQGWKNTQIYGGVIKDVKSAEDWIADYSAEKETGIMRDIGVGVGVGLIGLDVPLSAIGDTLTLPITIPVALMKPSQPVPPPPPPPTDTSFRHPDAVPTKP